jgi:hypothetical protein
MKDIAIALFAVLLAAAACKRKETEWRGIPQHDLPSVACDDNRHRMMFCVAGRTLYACVQTHPTVSCIPAYELLMPVPLERAPGPL